MTQRRFDNGHGKDRYRLYREIGYTLFPLTPALSLGERENGPPPLDHNRAGVYPTIMR